MPSFTVNTDFFYELVHAWCLEPEPFVRVATLRRCNTVGASLANMMVTVYLCWLRRRNINMFPLLDILFAGCLEIVLKYLNQPITIVKFENRCNVVMSQTLMCCSDEVFSEVGTLCSLSCRGARHVKTNGYNIDRHWWLMEQIKIKLLLEPTLKKNCLSFFQKSLISIVREKISVVKSLS